MNLIARLLRDSEFMPYRADEFIRQSPQIMSTTLGIFGDLSVPKQHAEPKRKMITTESEGPAPRPDNQSHTPFAIPIEENTAGDARAVRTPQALKRDNSFVISEPLGFGYEAPPHTFEYNAAQNTGNALSFDDDSHTIKQLELRAVFGMDREMDNDEIIQRASVLPGIRHVAAISASEMAAVDSVKNIISNLGFVKGALKLYSGSAPIEFIREGKTVLAVQTDGSFAPGVRETLILVARELGR